MLKKKNKKIHGCLQLWNFYSRVQPDTKRLLQSIFSCSIPHSFTDLTHEIASWTLEEKFHINTHFCIIICIITIYWTRKKWSSLSYSLNAKSLKSYPVQRVLVRICGLIAQGSVFLRSFFTHSHLNTRGRKENLIKLCKPDTQSRVCINFEKFPNLPSV